MNRKKTDPVFALGAVLLIAVVWIASSLRVQADLTPVVHQSTPEAHHFVREDGIFTAWADETETDLIAKVAIGTGDGYGGPLQVAVAVDDSGTLIGAVVAAGKETPAWMARVIQSDFISSMIGKNSNDDFEIGLDVDGVTGATSTARALADASADGSRTAAKAFGLPVPEGKPPKIVFGFPEVVLILLFGIGFLGHRSSFPYTKPVSYTHLRAHET